jgi:hypothetical protein
MSRWEKIKGTIETAWQIGLAGPLWKANAGNLDGRNAADAAFVNVRGLDPAIADDLVTKRYGDANYGGAGGAIGLSNHIVVSNFTITAGRSATIERYVEVAAGIALEIGADGDLGIR